MNRDFEFLYGLLDDGSRSKLTQIGQRASSPRSAGLMFRRQAQQTGVFPEFANAIRSLGLDPNSDDNVGVFAKMFSQGINPAAGADPARWYGSSTREDQRGLAEDYGILKVQTAAGDTGAAVEWTVETEVAIQDLILYVWDPDGKLRSGYFTKIKVDTDELILSPTSNQDFLPAAIIDIEDQLGEAPRSGGGIYIGDVEKETTISGTLYIPTSATAVDWGLVGRTRGLKKRQATRSRTW